MRKLVKLDRPLYHGTSFIRGLYIYVEGFKPPIYATTNLRRAIHYARARAALDGDDKYSIFTIVKLPKGTTAIADTYSRAEPDQFIITSKIPLYSWKRRDYRLKATKEELVRLQAFATAMSWR